MNFGYDDGEHSTGLAASDDRGTRVEFDVTQVRDDRFLAIIEALLEPPETTKGEMRR